MLGLILAVTAVNVVPLGNTNPDTPITEPEIVRLASAVAVID
jgi:threonine/homoserine efflux transporter RhtA